MANAFRNRELQALVDTTACHPGRRAAAVTVHRVRSATRAIQVAAWLCGLAGCTDAIPDPTGAAGTSTAGGGGSAAGLTGEPAKTGSGGTLVTSGTANGKGGSGGLGIVDCGRADCGAVATAGGSNAAGGGNAVGSGAGDGGIGGAGARDAGAGGPAARDAQTANRDATIDGGDAGACPANHEGTFVNLAVSPGQPLDRNRSDPLPTDAGTVPSGWNWYAIDGAVCRDGSPTGFYVRYGKVNQLMVYLEGGGACDTPGFCNFNPANISQHFNNGGESVLTSIGWAAGVQAPGTAGVFDFTNNANPFKDWNQIYVPYCTGDVHFGAKKNATIAGLNGTQQFVGYLNMQKFVARWIATFGKVERVVLTGASAGGFAVGLDFGLVQDSFGSVPVVCIDDSGPPMSSQYIPDCLQKLWRDAWGLDDALPSDCTECTNSAGGGLMNIVQYWRRKYPNPRFALVESVHDEVIRLFFSAGNNSCANAANADPIGLWLGTLGGTYDQNQFQRGLLALRNEFLCTGQMASYYVDAFGVDSLHQQLFRDRFYQAAATGSSTTIAQWVSDFLAGNMTQVGAAK